MVELLLSAGADINAANPLGCTALMLACHFGDVQIAELLLSAGADVQHVHTMRWTALDYALHSTTRDKNDLIKLLIAEGALIHLVPDNNSRSALCSAMYIEDVDRILADAMEVCLGEVPSLARVCVSFAKKLLMAGMDVNGRNDNGDTPLLAAAASGHPEVVSLLLTHLLTWMLFDPMVIPSLCVPSNVVIRKWQP